MNGPRDRPDPDPSAVLCAECGQEVQELVTIADRWGWCALAGRVERASSPAVRPSSSRAAGEEIVLPPGVSHSACNLRAAAAVTNGKRASTLSYKEMPYRWSQRWFDDRPIGTTVFGHERVIYLGNGEWQPLADE